MLFGECHSCREKRALHLCRAQSGTMQRYCALCIGEDLADDAGPIEEQIRQLELSDKVLTHWPLICDMAEAYHEATGVYLQRKLQ